MAYLSTLSIKSLQLSPSLSRKKRPPLSISTNPSHINLLHLRDLLTSTGQACDLFPQFMEDGSVKPVDIKKLGLAVKHSSVLVSVFVKNSNFLDEIENPNFSERFWFGGGFPFWGWNGRLVGFGRAVSDVGLTASIHDVAVFPSLQGLGIGRMIINRIIRLFFESCGFGKDVLESTTMIYCRTGNEEEEEVGWIHSDRKYITKIDGIGDTHPVWNTKFTALIDSSESDPNALMLNVEVYTRDPFFLTEKLHGSASVPLKEFFAKYLAKINEDHENIGFEVFEVGSFQLRKRGSDKPKGFIDVSIRISDEKDQGFGDRGEDEPMAAYPAPVNQPINYPPSNFPYNPPPNLPQSFTNPRPPPPNLGYFPNSNGLPPRPPPPNLEYYPNPNGLPENYIPLPSHTQGGLRPGFGMGIGAGALAGGVISSNDLLPDMNFPTNLHGGSLTISGNSFF
ncbi:uncharacterized protein LOC18432433 isoform X2 [Amborella trichopoda]|uniref:uncharacterized protein LOC18432433 isoform X2 n=1 Tax=Amborella trichopoda TaxID=13333 RepID=UPI0009C0A25E|nr:uncharacterized protein LOC18432433 isoform X2 [Amborella trichopoda]|eukprot:XP_020521820.1 uncharacterized protein LOC18432433 isoform X2 [Amborella trichopoda]